jgi:hypothetical protein
MLQYKIAMILHSQVREDVVGCLLTDLTTTLISLLSLLTSALMIGHKAAHFEIMKLNWDQTSRLHDERVKLLAQLGRTESPGADVESPGAAVESPGADVESPDAAVESPGADVESPDAAVESPGADVESPGADVASLIGVKSDAGRAETSDGPEGSDRDISVVGSWPRPPSMQRWLDAVADPQAGFTPVYPYAEHSGSERFLDSHSPTRRELGASILIPPATTVTVTAAAEYGA